MTDQYQEISLINYVKVIIKRKKRITLTAIFVLILSGLVFSYSSKSIYKSESTILIGSISNELIEPKELTITFLLTEATINEMLAFIDPNDSTITRSKIEKTLKNIEINGATIGLPKTSEQDQTFGKFIRIIYADENSERTLKGVMFFNDFILERHKKIYDEKIKIKDDRLFSAKKYLEELYKRIKTEENIINDLTNLRYPASYTIAQGASITAHTELHRKLLADARDLEETIYKETVITRDEMTKIISLPIKPLTPVQWIPIPIRVGIPIILGIFLGIIFAFSTEWWSKNRNELKN